MSNVAEQEQGSVRLPGMLALLAWALALFPQGALR